MKNVKLTALGALTLLVIAGCSTTAKTTKTEPGMPSVTAVSGKVVETMDGGGYTYVCLEKEGKKTWAAIPTTKVTVGQELKLLPGGEMTDFPSSTLKRTFDKIIFSGGVDDGKLAAAAKTKQEAINLSSKPILEGKVAETINVGTYTYLRLEKDGKSAWAAVPAVKVKVGDEVELVPGTDMGQFTSPSLKRTFDSIHFSSGLKRGGEPAIVAKAEDKAPAAAEQPKGLPSGHPSLGALSKAPAQDAPAPAVVTGKVVETTNAGGYTYICLEKEGKKTWAAVPPMQVKVGQEIKLAPGITMSNFKSSGLNRTFDQIIFSTGPMN